MKAILLVGLRQPGIDDSGVAPEFVTGVPISTVDVLGRCIAARVADMLLRNGVSEVAVIADGATPGAAAVHDCLDKAPNVTFAAASGENFWRTCERTFETFSENGGELMLVWRLGAYAELDVDRLTQLHLDQAARVTPVCDAEGKPLDIYMISGSRRNDAAFLFRHQLTATRMPCKGYVHAGYVNRLQNARDLRQLTTDALTMRCELRPIGTEIKPGVWAGQGARIARGARVLAPAYIGAYAKVRSAAVITRCSTVEHHSEIDCGSVVESSNVLSYSYVGAGLDVTAAIVGNRRIHNLRRNIEVEIADPRLIGTVLQHVPLRVVAAAASLVAFFPKQLARGLSAKGQTERPVRLQEAVNTPSAALKEPAGSPARAVFARDGVQRALQTGPSQYPSS